MKVTNTIMALVVLMAVLLGCEENQSQQRIDSLQEQIHLLETELLESREEVKSERNKNSEKTKEMDLITQEKKDLESTLNKMIVYHERLQGITQLEDFEYTEVGFKEDEKVVYIHNVSGDDSTMKRIYLLRAAIEFAGDTSEVISFWYSLENAETYIRGDYNPEETLFGWLGFDSKIGKIDHSTNPPTLIFNISGHDMENVEFGKYGYESQ